MLGSLKQKVILWFAIVVLILGAASWVGVRRIYNQILTQADGQMHAKLSHVLDVLEATNQTYLSLVHSSMRVLKLEAQRMGEPSLRQVTDSDGKVREELFFGNHPISNSFGLVDEVKQLMGGTATIFIREDDRFVRITTNVERVGGGRAVGTELDPNGKVIQHIRRNEPFYGVVDILGKPYITGYEPIRAADGSVIGIYYVGYALETLKVVHQALEEQRILDEGFFALLDPQDNVIFPDHNSPLAAKARELMAAADDHSKWEIVRETFVPWDYEVLGALYLPDVIEVTIKMIWQAGLLVGGVVVAILVVSFLLASRLSDALERAEVATHAAIEARDAAESANRTKSTFLANMSHELRTPMNAIIGYSEMLIEEAEDLEQDDFIPDLQKIRSAGKHLLALINDVLDLSKIEAGKMTIYLETFDIREMINDVVGTIQPLLDKNGNRLDLDLDSNIGSMHADLTKVRQALFNLLSNATKFTEKGVITLGVHRTASPSGDRIRFSVRDTGIGMSDEQLGRLFQAFTQADASTTRKYGGTGLGLVISRKFCQMMGGDISVESKRGAGTTFTIDLPEEVVEMIEPRPGTPEKAKTPSASSSAKTVLVIDDDPDAGDLMVRALEKGGYATLRAHNGGEGLELARTKKPDAITLDVMMPGMDGWSVLSVLKSDPETASIPVVMVTMLQDRRLGYALGVSDFLTKPVDAEKLRKVIITQIGSPKGNVMIVEDDPSNRDMLARLLQREGLVAITAENGSVALEKLASGERPSLILLDLMMPVMDGFEFLRILRAEPALQKIPVVVVTAKDLTVEDRNRLSGSVEEIIQKGAIDRDKLLRDVVSMVGQADRSET